MRYIEQIAIPIPPDVEKDALLFAGPREAVQILRNDLGWQHDIEHWAGLVLTEQYYEGSAFLSDLPLGDSQEPSVGAPLCGRRKRDPGIAPLQICPDVAREPYSETFFLQS